jgi:hypothetical protein
MRTATRAALLGAGTLANASPRLLRLLSRKPERANRRPGFVSHPHPPFAVVPKPAAHVPQNLAGDHDCLSAGFFRVGELVSDRVDHVHAIVDVEEVAGHPRQRTSRQSVAITSGISERNSPGASPRPLRGRARPPASEYEGK